MSGIDKLVERQMRNWELVRTQRVTVPEAHRKEVEDFIAISRQEGAGGGEVAGMLGERLGWPVFDREILHAMAGDDAVHRQVYGSMDERDLSWFEEVARVFTQPELVKNDYFHNLTRTTLSLARQGRAVFVGRAADLILPKEVGVRVRLVAPIDFRVRRIAQQRQMTLEEARKEVTRIDHERAEFIRHHFHISIDEATRCDLTINRGRISAAQAVELILSAHENLIGSA